MSVTLRLVTSYVAIPSVGIIVGSLIAALFVVTVGMHLLWFAYITLWWRRKRRRMAGFSHTEIREWIKRDPVYDAFACVCGLLLWIWLPVLWLQFAVTRKVKHFCNTSKTFRKRYKKE